MKLRRGITVIAVLLLAARVTYGQSDPHHSRFQGKQIESIEFSGNTRASTQDLLDQMRATKVGESFDPERLEVDLDRLRILYYADRGYLNARFGSVEVSEGRAGLRLVIRAEEGLQYRLGKLSVADATVFTADQIAEMSGVKPGNIVRGYSDLQKGLERIEKSYDRFGYLHFFVGFYAEFRSDPENEGQGIVDITLEIEEGDRFVIRRVEILGTRLTKDRQILRRIPFKEGEPVSRGLITETIRSLGRLPGLEAMTEEDIKIRADKDAHVVDILINVREKK